MAENTAAAPQRLDAIEEPAAARRQRIALRLDMAHDLRLGIGFGYWSKGPPPGALESLLEAEKLGYDSAWTAEAYGSDALIPLAWWGSRTERIKLGTAIVQIAARTPAATAMSAMTFDHLCGGRLILGLGVSGPQVVEGWHGQPFSKPLARMREYIGILREIWARRGPVTAEGPHYPLPYRGGDGLPEPTGLGKPLKSSIHPLREDIPIYLAAEGPKNIALGAELCDGWLALFYSPNHEDIYAEALNEGFSKPNARRTKETFEVAANVPLIITDNAEAAMDAVRPMYALYFGGMGAKSVNFHANVPIRMGYEAEVRQIQDLYLNGKKDEAAAALPTKLIDELTLIGTKDEIRGKLEAWRESSVNTLLISGDPQTLRTAAELVLG